MSISVGNSLNNLVAIKEMTILAKLFYNRKRQKIVKIMVLSFHVGVDFIISVVLVILQEEMIHINRHF